MSNNEVGYFRCSCCCKVKPHVEFTRDPYISKLMRQEHRARKTGTQGKCDVCRGMKDPQPVSRVKAFWDKALELAAKIGK